MEIIPAIDMLGGQCVRLYQGNYERSSSWGDPLEVAQDFVRQGAKWLHLVDLSRARDVDDEVNQIIIGQLARLGSVQRQLGGGIRSIEQARYWLSLGIERIILGSVAIEQREVLKAMVQALGGDRIMVAIDERAGEMASSGWLRTSRLDPLVFAQELIHLGVQAVVYTDTMKDGTLGQPNFDRIEQLCRLGSLRVFAAGGISSVQDCRQLDRMGVAGVIIGQALYHKRVDLGALIAEFAK